jgi:hypothetical protein
MKAFLLTAMLFFALLISITSKAQLQFENTYGLLVNDPSGISVLRGTVGLNNLIPVAENKENKFNIGVYYTTEICCVFSSKYTKPVRQDLLRDIAGLSLRFFKNVSLFAGMGLFRQGVLSKTPYGSMRKELGVSFQIPKHNLTLSSSYGTTKKLSLNVGYHVPLRKSTPDFYKNK